MAKKSLYEEIIEALEDQHKNIKTDKHYSNKRVLRHTDLTPNAAAYHALSDAIAMIKAIKELRNFNKSKNKRNKK